MKLAPKLISIFLAIQLAGIYLGSKLIQVPELEPETSAAAGPLIFIYLLVVTAIVLLIIKYFSGFMKGFELIAVFFGSEIFFETLFMGFIKQSQAFMIALVLAAALTGIRHKKRNLWTQNTAITLSAIGIGSQLGASLGIWPILILISLLAVYDVVAVFKTKHMVTMAKEIIKQKLAFTLAIPTQDRVFQIGGGDLIMPIILEVSILRYGGIVPAIAAMIGGLIGVTGLVIYLNKKPGRPMPALPPIVLGLLTGFALYLGTQLIG